MLGIIEKNSENRATWFIRSGKTSTPAVVWIEEGEEGRFKYFQYSKSIFYIYLIIMFSRYYW